MSKLNSLPPVLIVHGSDDYAVTQRLDALQAALGDPSMAGLNQASLDGRNASIDDLRNAVMAMPFLLDVRLVVMNNALAKLEEGAKSREQEREAFLSLLTQVPATTRLVVVTGKTLDDSTIQAGYRARPVKDHWLIAWARQAGTQAAIERYALPEGREMSRWVMEEAKRQGGTFTNEAADTLVELVTSDTRLAASEIGKLLAYVNYARAVEDADVLDLTPSSAPADVFAMVDALGSGNAALTMRLLNHLLEEQEAPAVFGMVVRQFRLLLLAREGLDARMGEAELAEHMSAKPFVVKKIIPQARRFSAQQLGVIYHRLYELDLAVKTGTNDLPTGLMALAAGLTGAR